MIQKLDELSERETRRHVSSVSKSLALVLLILSYCMGDPIQDKNVGRWRKRPWRIGEKKTEDHRKDTDYLFSTPRSSFTWEALINGPTGVASSNEHSGPFLLTSEKVSRWPLFRKETSRTAAASATGTLCNVQEDQERRQRVTEEQEQLVIETSRQFIDTWSDFLCQGSISLGILRCMKVTGGCKETNRRRIWSRRRQIGNPRSSIAASHSNTDVSSSSLLARFVPLPVKLLEFGNAVESLSPLSAEINDKRDLVILGSWDIPLKGGALILEDDQSLQKGTSSSRSSGHDNRGALTFAIAKRRRVHDHDQSCISVESSYNTNSYQIITGIRDYRPWLAGGGYAADFDKEKSYNNIWDALKANRETTTRRLCHGFYLSTQSMIHAYVTWRFHHAWRQKLAIAVRQTATKTTDT